MASIFNDYGATGGCCEPKVDAISVLVAIGAIAAVSVFLRQAVIDNMVMMARRKKRDVLSFILKGQLLKRAKNCKTVVVIFKSCSVVLQHLL